MRLLKRRQAAIPGGSHIGIRLRVSLPDAGPILDGTSDHLYYVAKYGGPSICQPSCLPGCDKHGWLDVLGGPEMGLIKATAADLVIEIKPVELPDYISEDAP